jgi:hypothetical protein
VDEDEDPIVPRPEGMHGDHHVEEADDPRSGLAADQLGEIAVDPADYPARHVASLQAAP